MKRYPFYLCGILVLALLLTGCFSRLAMHDGPYRGKVIDAVTKEPIEGVVVLATWYKKTPTVAGAVSSFYDAQESVTDEKGEFFISGQGPRVLSNLEYAHLHIFKAGYEYLGGFQKSLDYDIYLKIRDKSGGSRAIIPLKKLTMEERRKRHTPPRPDFKARLENIKFFLKEIDKERIELGLEPFGTWGGKKYD